MKRQICNLSEGDSERREQTKRLTPPLQLSQPHIQTITILQKTMMPSKMGLAVLWAYTLLFHAHGASETGMHTCLPVLNPLPTLATGSASSFFAVPSTPTSIADVSSFQSSTSPMRAAVHSFSTAGTASTNDQSLPLDPPLYLPGKPRNGRADFSKSFKNNSEANLKQILRSFKTARQSIRLHGTLPVGRRPHDVLHMLVTDPLLKVLASSYVAYESLTALSSKAQKTLQKRMTESKSLANIQVAAFTQWGQEKTSTLRGWACGSLWLSTEVTK